jgi:GNAT superfamily N-acetyltransferase
VAAGRHGRSQGTRPRRTSSRTRAWHRRTYCLLIGAYHAPVEQPRIRPATAGDAGEIARLRWEFSTEERVPTEAHEAFTQRMAGDVRQFLASGRWSIWVAEDPDHAGRAIGTLFLQRVDKVPRPYPRPAAWGYITSVYVAPSWRDRGVGRQMLDVAIADARREGLDTLILWPNQRAIPFYERAGFAPATGAMEMPLDE